MKIRILHIAILVLIGGFMSSFSQSSFTSTRLVQTLADYVKSVEGKHATIEILSDLQDLKFSDKGVKASLSNYQQKENSIYSVNFIFATETKKLKILEVKFKVKIMEQVWVATRSLGKNSVIEEEDLIEVLVDVKDINPNSILNKYQIVGSKINRTIAKNKIILSEYLSENNIIKSGDKVNIIVESGAITIRSVGSALQDAGVGQKVRVKRDGKSSQVLQGTVTEDGSVVIGLN